MSSPVEIRKSCVDTLVSLHNICYRTDSEENLCFVGGFILAPIGVVSFLYNSELLLKHQGDFGKVTLTTACLNQG